MGWRFMRFIFLGIAVLLSACTTTENQNIDLSKIDTTNPYVVGYYVKYSEICAQFRGSGADNLAIRNLKQTYQTNRQFKKGYDVNRGTEGFDAVTNLPDCDLAKAVVNKSSRHSKRA